MSRFVWGLSRMMTLKDVATITGLSWDTAKAIVRPFLAKEMGFIREVPVWPMNAAALPRMQQTL